MMDLNAAAARDDERDRNRIRELMSTPGRDRIAERPMGR